MSSDETERPRDSEHWAKPVGRLHVEHAPDGAKNLVEGKRLVGPVQGFGQMWQKSYRIRLDGTSWSPWTSCASGRSISPSSGLRATSSTLR